MCVEDIRKRLGSLEEQERLKDTLYVLFGVSKLECISDADLLIFYRRILPRLEIK